MYTCHCTAECDEYGNFCDDVQECREVFSVEDASEFTKYPEFDNLTGSVELTFFGGRVQIEYDLMGVEPICAEPGIDLWGFSSCGIHIHESCNDGEPLGAYVFSREMYPEDVYERDGPWWGTHYYSDEMGNTSNSIIVEHGLSFEETEGSVLVFHTYASYSDVPIVLCIPIDTSEPTVEDMCETPMDCDMGEFCNMDTEMYGHCDSCEYVDCDSDYPEDRMPCCGKEDMYDHLGQGLCTSENGRSAANYSANDFDLKSCGDACANEEDCLGYSLSRNGRCAIFMDHVNPEHEMGDFGLPNPGAANWVKGTCLTKTDSNSHWECYVKKCETESEESEEESREESKDSEDWMDLSLEGDCNDKAIDLTWSLAHVIQMAEQQKDDYDMLHTMFEQCLAGEDSDEYECMDHKHWMDNEGRSCEDYEHKDMCKYTYL
eukprot:UN25741